MESEELLLHGLPTYSPACLRLTNVLMEQIIRLLPTQTDRYEACLVHRVWTTAAMGILWESPQFASPNSVRHFLNTIRRNKQLALTVRKLDLVLSTTGGRNDAFRESMRMILGRHVPYQDIPLAAPQVIQAVVQQCERLDTLSIYGWQLEEIHLRLIAAYLPHLQRFCIVGSRCNKPITLPPLAASSLRKLHLYADFIIQPTRFTELESLCVSLHHDASFDKLCNHQSTFPKVRELKLANAARLKNVHIDTIFSVFPRLVSLALEDIYHPINPSRLVQSSTVKHLILRPTDGMDFSPPLENAAPPPAHLSTILFDTCRINDTHFDQLVFHLDSLTSISLYNCPLLTDEAMVRICNESAPLEKLEIVQCIHVGNRTVCALYYSPIVYTLRHFRVESSGLLRPEDMYELISSAVSYSLECIDIGGYPAVRDAFLGRQSTGKRIVLDKSGIQSIVRQGIGPKERHLTSNQIVRLAKALDMNMRQLESLLDQIQLDKYDISSVTEATTMNVTSTHSTSDCSSVISVRENDYQTENIAENERVREKKQQRGMQLHQQKPDEQAQQPVAQEAIAQQAIAQRTIAQLQQNDRRIQEIGELHQHLQTQQQHQPQQPSHSGLIQPYNVQNDSDHESSETVTASLTLQEQQRGSYEVEDGSEHSHAKQFEGQDDLGGWGMTSDLSWLKSAERSSGDINSIESGLHSKHSYEHAWHQIARESPVVTAQNRISRSQQPQDFAEGWGTPRNVTEWSDDRLGYAHDVLEKQKQTIFYNQSEDGIWFKLPFPTTTSVRAPGNSLRSLKSESNTDRPPSRGPSVLRKKSLGPDSLRRSSAGPSRPTYSRPKHTESANVDKWAAFSASEMQQFEDAKKRKSLAQEVEELEIPDLINLDSKGDDILQLVPTTSSPPPKS